ncbi:MAG: orotate phosphoribosyltransferase [Cryomorphaceae bacterium BACL21 MAG-121220-bin10]|jgi:ribosome-associated toxin RatA of RatAB toxin-antitoxin module|nr:MAG: orotate phosphoribosyltransferase [Cryomorphaceae bacterium BACL21 MAG-121220-bin10]|tara:strand:+ start:4347 stop:4739 length:393 start_codon:yes stop_codon:yes gene_type:complete
MEIKGDKVVINKSAEAVFDFLNQVENFEQLMPESISKFEVLGPNAFLFALKGMPEIALETKSSVRPTQLVLGAKSDKLPFNLTGDLTPSGDNSCQIELCFSGDFNPMMAMMIKGPITKFIETLTTNLQKI